MTYSVSYVQTPTDNGHAVSFESLTQAEAFRRWAIAEGYWQVSGIW